MLTPFLLATPISSIGTPHLSRFTSASEARVQVVQTSLVAQKSSSCRSLALRTFCCPRDQWYMRLLRLLNVVDGLWNILSKTPAAAHCSFEITPQNLLETSAFKSESVREGTLYPDQHSDGQSKIGQGAGLHFLNTH